MVRLIIVKNTKKLTRGLFVIYPRRCPALVERLAFFAHRS